MKKLIALLLAFIMVFSIVGCTAQKEQNPPADTAGAQAPKEDAQTPKPAADTDGAVQTKTIGFYADNVDSYYAAVSDTLIALAKQDPEIDWTINVVTGTGAAADQLNAVQDFISAGVDAVIVIQNNAETSSECIAMCNDANIAYFGATHSIAGTENAAKATAWEGYDFEMEGYLAGKQAAAAGVKKIVNIEGVLGQGSAGAQSLGFIKGFEEAGVDFGGFTAEQIATEKPTKCSDDFSIVQWASGGWMQDSAYAAMADIIVSLGADGFDCVYVQSNPMMQGVLQAMEEAGLDIESYYLCSGNGREISWGWVEDGVIDCDVNQSACLEADVLYQQLKAYFNGEEFPRFLNTFLTEYNTQNIAQIKDSLLTVDDPAKYLETRASGSFDYSIYTNPNFKDCSAWFK